MKASDIMTSPVVSVRPETSVQEIASLLLEHRISGVPVLENGQLVGLVSEADLLHRHEIGTDCVAYSGLWWMRLFAADRSMSDFIRSHARHARDIMTREVVSIDEDTSAQAIADLLETRDIKRVPVLRRGRLVGIVSRADLVEALAAHRHPAPSPRHPDDSAIRGELLAALERQPWWKHSSDLVVTDGVVSFVGTISSEDERQAARVAAENVPGVRRIEDRRFLYEDLPSMV